MLKRNIIYDIALNKILKNLLDTEFEFDYSSISLKEKIKKDQGYTFLYTAEESKKEKSPDFLFEIVFDFSKHNKTQFFNDINVSIRCHESQDEFYWFYFDEEIEQKYKQAFAEYENDTILSSLSVKNTNTIKKRF